MAWVYVYEVQEQAKLICRVKSQERDFPGGPVVKTWPSNAGARVQSLVGELRSHMPHDQRAKA